MVTIFASFVSTLHSPLFPLLSFFPFPYSAYSGSCLFHRTAPPLLFWICFFHPWDRVAFGCHVDHAIFSGVISVYLSTHYPDQYEGQTLYSTSMLQVSLQKQGSVDSSQFWVSLHLDLKLECGVSHRSLRALTTELNLNLGDQMENIPPILFFPSLVPHVQSPTLLSSSIVIVITMVPDGYLKYLQST